ncbi:MAG TPA: hypothetical protein VIU35_10245 [Chitinophagaceae bacterium]
MKKTFVLDSILIITASTFCQQTNPATALTKQDYMQKSKVKDVFREFQEELVTLTLN